MGNKLEQLLNSLIEAGWNPFGFGEKCLVKYYSDNYIALYRIEKTIGGDECLGKRIDYSRRELASKESGLWQFVCENGYNQYRKEYWEGYTKYNMKAEYWDEGDYEYYLIESALKDESELEDFLLQNIKVYG